MARQHKGRVRPVRGTKDMSSEELTAWEKKQGIGRKRIKVCPACGGGSSSRLGRSSSSPNTRTYGGVTYGSEEIK